MASGHGLAQAWLGLALASSSRTPNSWSNYPWRGPGRGPGLAPDLVLALALAWPLLFRNSEGSSISWSLLGDAAEQNQ